MAQTLRLKRQKYSLASNPVLSVSVYVDTGLPHLDEPFTYSVTEKQSNIAIGSLVSVPFGSRTLSGIVASISKQIPLKTKPIHKVIHNNPILNLEQIELIQASCNRWTGTFWDMARFTFPNIPAKSNVPQIEVKGIARKVAKPELKIGSNYQDLIELIETRTNPGRQILILVPGKSDLQFITSNIKRKYIEYGTHLNSQERIKNYLSILSGKPKVIISTRSGAFLPLNEDAEILVVGDLAFENYETHYPHWNTRDLVLLRSKSHSVTFYSHSPSLETARLTEVGWMRISSNINKSKSIYFRDGRLGFQAIVKNNLKKGPVLILVPNKGYVNAVVCGKCRNVYKCECGGNLVKTSSSNQLICKLCGLQFRERKCAFCDSTIRLDFSKGVDRISEELGKQFPGTLISKFLKSAGNSKGGEIVLSTYDAFSIEKYSAVIALNFEKFAYQTRLRSLEFAKKILFDIRALNSHDLYLDVDSNSFFGTVAIKGDPIKFARQELNERAEALLPPHFRLFSVECDLKTVQVLSEQKFIKSVHYSDGTALVKVPIEDGAKMSFFLQNLRKYRSLRKLKTWNIKVDPLDI